MEEDLGVQDHSVGVLKQGTACNLPDKENKNAYIIGYNPGYISP